MPMPGIEFDTAPAPAPALSSRADVTVFAGLVARRAVALPDALRMQLQKDGWSEKGLFKVPESRFEQALGIPVPVYSWAEFDALFDWQSRAVSEGSADHIPCALGLAVKQFFRQGGAKAYILRCGDPVPLVHNDDDEAGLLARKRAAISRSGNIPANGPLPILPGFGGKGEAADPLDPTTWVGAAAIFAIPDAAMLLLPDIVDLCAGAPQIAPPHPSPLSPPENFRPCAPLSPLVEPDERIARPEYLAPRLDQKGFQEWTAAMRFACNLLARPKGPAHRRDVMLIAAMPLPLASEELPDTQEHRPLQLLENPELGKLPGTSHGRAIFSEDALGIRHIQLGYPWMVTAESRACPEGLQSPEGTLAGVIARSALQKGAFRSAAGSAISGSAGLYPDLAGSDIARAAEGHADWMGERLCLFGLRHGETQLLSDATMAADTSWRVGGISRLMGVILRASRYLGDDLLFEPSGPALWNRLRGSMEGLLGRLRSLGAFAGNSADEAFTVRCDRGTMTQTDIDAGRVICEIGFNPAYPVERIRVTLALRDAPAKMAEAA